MCYLVFDRRYGFSFHTKLIETIDSRRTLVSEPAFSEIYEAERDRIEFLAARFFKFLRDRPGCYVIKANKGIDELKLKRVLSLLKTHNELHSLLYVKQDPVYRLGMTEHGFYCATVPRFAEYASTDQFESFAWKRLIVDMSRRPEFERILESMFV